MTAKGKINASKVQAGDRVLIDTDMHVYKDDECGPSRTKTGESVVAARVLDKLKVSNLRGYIIVTNVGRFYAEPIQTMWLAPEDAAGIKRAHVEALEENKRQDRAATPAEVAAPAEAELVREAATAARQAPTADAAAEIIATALGLPAEAGAAWAAANWVAPGPTPAELVAAMDEAHEPTTAECENEWHRTAPARARLLCPECPAPAPGFDPEAGASAPDANRHASQTGGLSPALRLQAAGRVLRAEPLTFDLPPLAHGRELVRLADIAPSNFLTLDSHAGKVGPNSKDDLEEPEMTAKTETQNHTGSTVVALIERVWDCIRAEHPELPAVVVTTGSGEGVKWGHFRPESWKRADDGSKLHEFFLASEALAKGATQVLQTTIHEAAHTLSRVRGNKDTSRQNRYHNGTFRKTAEELGLEHKGASPDKTHGFSFVTLTAATKAKYAAILEELDRELKLTGLLPFWLGGTDDEDEKGGEKITKPKGTEGEDGETKKRSGNLKATCACDEPVIVYLSQKVLDLAVVRCDSCESLFSKA